MKYKRYKRYEGLKCCVKTDNKTQRKRFSN